MPNQSNILTFLQTMTFSSCSSSFSIIGLGEIDSFLSNDEFEACSLSSGLFFMSFSSDDNLSYSSSSSIPHLPGSFHVTSSAVLQLFVFMVNKLLYHSESQLSCSSSLSVEIFSIV